jgi:hypothetical protein
LASRRAHDQFWFRAGDRLDRVGRLWRALIAGICAGFDYPYAAFDKLSAEGYGGSSFANAPERASTISSSAKFLRRARLTCSSMGLRPGISSRIEVPHLLDR